MSDYAKRAAAKIDRSEVEPELERLRAIVDKLPKTADGVPVVPGMRLWVFAGAHDYEPSGLRSVTVRRLTAMAASGWEHRQLQRTPLSKFYSTREAAEAAEVDECLPPNDRGHGGDAARDSVE